MTAIKVSRNFWVALGTLIVIGIVFTYYLGIYVKGRERMIAEEKRRQLERIGHNIVAFRNELSKQTLLRLNILEKIFSSPCPRDAEDCLKKQNEKISLIKADGSASSWKRGQPLDIHDIGIESANSKVGLRIKFSDTLRTSILNGINTKVIVVRVQDGICDSRRRDVQERNLRVGSHQDSTACRRSAIIYQNLDSEIRLLNLDSLIFDSHGLSKSGVRKVRIGDIEYALYSCWVSFARDDELFICSLEDVSELKAEAYAVEPWIIVNLVTITVLLFLGMPLLKLIVMNEVERLQISNVMLGGISIVVGFSFITLGITFTWHSNGEHYTTLDKHLSELSSAVRSGFLSELKAIRKELFASADKKPSWETVQSSDQGRATNSRYYPIYNEIAWADSTGAIKRMWSSNEQAQLMVSLPNVNSRRYFQAALKGDLWSSPDSCALPPFYIEFVRSILDGQFQAVVSNSYRDDTCAVIGISTKLFSCQYSIFPPGFEVCIIDDDGEVMYHSTAEKSLQENFLDESGNRLELMSAIKARTSSYMSVTYDKRRYRIFAHPIEGVPLHMLVMYPLDLYKTPLVMTVWYAFVLIGALFFIMVVHALLLYVITYRPTKLKIKRYFLSWLRPRSAEGYRDKYVKSLSGGILLLTFELVVMFFPVTKEDVIGVIVSPVLLFAFQYMLYPGREELDGEFGSGRNVRRFLRTTAALILMINCAVVILFGTNGRTFWMFLFQVISICLLLFPTTRFFAKIERFVFPHWGYRKLFLYSSMVWVTSVSVIPVLYFYKLAYREEYRIWTRSISLAAVRSFDAREKLLDGFKQRFQKDEVKRYGNYQGATGILSIRLISKSPDNLPVAKDSFYESVLFEISPSFDSTTKFSAAYVFRNSADLTWQSKGECIDTLYYRPRNGCEGAIISAARVPDFMNINYSSATFVLAILVTLIFAFRVVRFLLRRVYGFEVIKSIDECNITPDYFELRENIGKNFFLVGVPYCGKGRLLEEFASRTRFRVLRINLQTQINSLPAYQGQSVVVIEHFEFGINNHELNKTRLRVLQEYQARPNVHIILSSAVQPGVILDYYERKVQLVEHLKDRVEFRIEYLEYKHALRYWRSVLGGYLVLYIPLKPQGKIDRTNLIEAECMHGTFLPKLYSHLANQSIGSFSEREDFILKVEEMAEVYYQSIWNSFSKNEKRLLHDLAVDRYVNIKNLPVIRVLLQKGVLVMVDSLRIFNKSFNNFVLSVVRDDEEMMMQSEVRRKGSWSAVQMSLILIFLSVALFISFAQKDVLQHLNAIMTAIGGVTALVLRFGGLVTIGGGKQRE